MQKTQPTQQKTTGEKGPRPWIKPSDQGSMLVLTLALLVMSLSSWWYQSGHRGALIEIDRAEPLHAQYLVDINRADWPEIIQLPGLGETLAQRILSERSQNGPFQKIDDLVRVNGIGPNTLEKIRPYLLPIPDEKDWAVVEHGEVVPVQ
ncbi:MAG: helix-hairpin-helix domain-containing protein [Pirellulales bacterium]|nr:helix-hairpin-helix domain-containing protein [Pirellulales bacterium]